MNNPTLYSMVNQLERRNIARFFQEYFRDFKGGGLTLDVGCGDGSVTEQVILKNTGGKVIGVDISQSMIEHAKRTHINPNLEFHQFDISSSTLPADYVGPLDRIVSSFCFHLIQNQRFVFYSTLIPSGNIDF